MLQKFREISVKIDAKKTDLTLEVQKLSDFWRKLRKRLTKISQDFECGAVQNHENLGSPRDLDKNEPSEIGGLKSFGSWYMK